MIYTKLLKILFLVFLCLNVKAQNITVGTLFNTPESENGYTLFSPLGNLNTFLINNCGELVNRWSFSQAPGLGAYLHSDGSLYRSCRVNNSSMPVSGQGGRIERRDWDGNLLWAYNYNGQHYNPHHDFCILPNGNVILIVAERKTRQEVFDAGRDSTLLPSIYNNMLTEYLVELEPIGTDSARVVWEWKAWDHLVQDHDSLIPNYGNPELHPELIDLNFTDHPDLSDWLHSNSVEYNAELDLLIMSVRHFNEVWVIDHSTTTAEAAGHIGGRRNKGGDLLYRWGNPEAYRAGSQADQVFEGQHSARWTKDRNIMVYNNGSTRGYSSADVITLPMDSMGFFQQPLPSSAFLPFSTARSYLIDPLFSSGRLSGVQELNEGNILISSGVMGYMFEINDLGIVVWAYRNPVGPNGIASQGNIPMGGANEIFNCMRYPSNFSGFVGKDLSPTNPIELNYDISHCETFSNTETFKMPDPSILIYPNPTKGSISIESESPLKKIQVLNILGQEILIRSLSESYSESIMLDLPAGIYFVRINEFGPMIKIILEN